MNIMIIEDELKTASLLKEFIEKTGQNRVIQICDSIENTVEFIQKSSRKPDLLFMDIQLSDGICFEIFERISITSPVIFCSAYEDYAIQAFKSNGVDYILKPFQEKDVESALLKLQRLQQPTILDTGTANRLNQIIEASRRSQVSFLIRFRGKMFPIQAKDIGAVTFENENTYLYLLSKEKHPVDKTIEEVEISLDDNQFFRINRQMIVNRDAIREIEPFFNRKVIVSLSVETRDKAIVSRLKVTPFLYWIEHP
jgi:DNA-binding LytR/AlgR family response regulator